MWKDIEKQISEATGATFIIRSRLPVAGGCINEAVCLLGDRQAFFLKLNCAESLDMFEAEAAGLAAMRASGSVRVPEAVAWGRSGEHSWLALEHIEFGDSSEKSDALLGEQLAQMHRCQAERFGWERDNTIGSTPQPNSWSDDWPAFLGGRRLGFQLRLAEDNGAGNRLLNKGEQLLPGLKEFFSSYRPHPSLLHGDLWAGNSATDSGGNPVLFDPAVYFGDREADIAMTELFGGFSEGFYRAYNAAWPLDAGYPVRRKLYNLYHVLNHFNLFGDGYERQAEGMLDALLAEIR